MQHLAMDSRVILRAENSSNLQHHNPATRHISCSIACGAGVLVLKTSLLPCSPPRSPPCSQTSAEARHTTARADSHAAPLRQAECPVGRAHTNRKPHATAAAQHNLAADVAACANLRNRLDHAGTQTPNALPQLQHQRGKPPGS